MKILAEIPLKTSIQANRIVFIMQIYKMKKAINLSSPKMIENKSLLSLKKFKHHFLSQKIICSVLFRKNIMR
jgi:hypothetical protein